MNAIDLSLIRDTLLFALREDVGTGDITSRSTIPVEDRATGRYTTKQALVVAGLSVIREIVSLVDPEVEFKAVSVDGVSVSAGTVLAEIRGGARPILTVERTSL